MPSPKDISDVREKALQLLASRAHSTHELRQKLLRKFPGQKEEVESVLSECTELRLLDDEKFAESLVRYRRETTPKGRFGLKIELQKKGIPTEIISGVLRGIGAEEESLAAKKLAERKFSILPPELAKEKKKERLFRFLYSKGFDRETALKVVNAVMKK